MLPGKMSLKRPKPARRTVLGSNCQAIAVLGCRMANGVEEKTLPKCVWIAAFSGCFTSCEMEAKEPPRRAICSCGFNGLELDVSRIPNVHVSFRVAFQVSCAYRSRFKKLNGSFVAVGKVSVAVEATP